MAVEYGKILLDGDIGTSVQAFSNALTDLANVGVVPGNSRFLVGTGAGTLAWETASTAKTSIGLGNVENTQLSTWVGSANITTLGTIQNLLHIYKGAVRAADANSLLILENNNYAFINILTPNDKQGGIFFGDPEDNNIGRIVYDHSDNTLGFGTSNSDSDIVIDENHNVGINTIPKSKFTVEGTLTLKEQASADGDNAAYGQVWVKSDNPNTLWFTDDGGGDIPISTPFSAYTNDDSDSQPLAQTHAYLAVTDGFVSVTCILATQDWSLTGHVGLNNNPFGEGITIAKVVADQNLTVKSIFFAVAKGEYFDIRTEAGSPSIYWKSVGLLSNPIDQEA